MVHAPLQAEILEVGMVVWDEEMGGVRCAEKVRG